ncbi:MULTISPECIES: hypothetical protein [unclassified Methylobacterium]|uniref:hypothetical protein n=1 Tax=unclassified Methylobacterium TaxID=2615210 RepID=UPI000CC48CFB|nr:MULTISPECIES: hypothetical protein [unclassified Methylobacterium]PIU05169.1 MAG: hypothetical protein COT56_16195 [Methylobacterium sp. CG09_land_8_20_14_0_10_71_15]PIU12514.1 MAG: hypothetical protein COT28_14605 [Methylobacterium sp. CG08_land_8_20_14_0_20_71_15]GBU16236.1 hypothetical protein AwMethylo_04510 [Methylobacterium sp.]
MRLGFDEAFEDRPVPLAKPGDGLPFSERLDREIGDLASGKLGFLRVHDAALQQSQLLDLSRSRVIREEQQYDGIIAAVQRSSGVRLDNPWRGGYLAEAGGYPDPMEFRDDPFDRQAEIFRGKVSELRASSPAVEAAVAAAEAEFAPRAIVKRAEGELTAAREAATYTGSFLGQVTGGGVAAFRDPLTYFGLLFGAGAAAGRTVASRIFGVAWREAAVNAGISAAQQPFVQAGRAELGMPYGFGEAAENVALSGLVGAAFGGGLQGARELARAVGPKRSAGLERAMAPDASAGDVAAGLREAGIALPREEADVLRQAVGVERADIAALRDVPPGVGRGPHADALAEAVARAEDPSAPPPALPYPTRPGVTDDAALAVLERTDLHPIDALVELRGDLSLVESALSSRSPAIREAGVVALLPDDAFAMVRDELVDPRHAAMAVRAAVEPERQTAIMADLAELRPSTVAEAREIIDAAVAAQTARARNAGLMGEALPPEAFPGGATGIGREGLFGRAAEVDPAQAGLWRERQAALEADYETYRMLDAGPERDAVARRYMEGYAAAVDGAGLADSPSSGSVSGPNAGSKVARQTGSDMRPPEWATSTASTDVQAAPGVSTANALSSEADRTAGRQSQLMNRTGASEVDGAAAQEAARVSSREDVRGLVPTVRDDGSVGFVRRGQAELAGERDLFLNDVVRSCR